MSHQVFISAAPRDRTTANAVRAVLEAEGISCWIAGRDLAPDADPVATAGAAIAAAQVMVLIFSARANEAQEQIKRELQSAAQSQTPVLPFRIENVKPVRVLEYFLPANQFVDAFPPPMDAHLRRLVGMLKPVLDKAAPRAPMAAPIPASTPAPAITPIPEPEPLHPDLVAPEPPQAESGPFPVEAELPAPVIETPPAPPAPVAEEVVEKIAEPVSPPLPEPAAPEPVIAAPAASLTAQTSTPTQEPPRQEPPVPKLSATPSQEAGFSKPMVLALAAVIAIALGAGAWWFLKPGPSPKEQQAWTSASQQDAIPTYQSYLGAWPKGFFRDQASARVTALTTEAQGAYAKAKAANTSAAYESFLATYAKQGVDVSEARAADDTIRAEEAKAKAAFDTASSAHTRESYQGFLKDFGSSSYAAQARQNLAACHTETRNTTTTKTTVISESASGSGTSSEDACDAARERATSQAESSCRESSGKMGKVRVTSQAPQNNGLQGGRILGSLFGAITGSRKESWKCTDEISAACEVSTSGPHQVDICP